MDSDYGIMVTRLLLSVVAGGMIGLERTYNGRPAGFRTHTLVCMASALLMQFTVQQWALLAGAPLETVRVDPTRMAQGIMTGIGFLGAGVIMKEGITIRGLTTAASIWITAAIGIMLGMGMLDIGFTAAVLALGVLSVFRWLERVVPTLHYARLEVRFKRAEAPSLGEVKELVARHGIDGNHPSYRLEADGRIYVYQMTVRARHNHYYQALAASLNNMEQVLEFTLDPTGD
ncbi:MAG: MgtC/SapB family protein [Nitrospirae bacterium]|nr:MgtC/SapB family protein [Nitrospirota bacterium]